MKERMAKLRAMRVKKGGSIWTDMASGLIHTALPVVSGVAGEMLGGPVGAAAGDAAQHRVDAPRRRLRAQ